MGSILKKMNCKSRKVSFISAALNAVSLIVFLIYGAVYSYYDFWVFGCLLIGIYCSLTYAFVAQKKAGILPVLSIIAVTIALGVFFLNSYPVWADRLNNISMYGSRGTLLPVISIIVLLLLTIVSAIAACFMKEEYARQDIDKKSFTIFSGGMAGILVIVGIFANTTTLGANVNQYAKDTASILDTLFASSKSTSERTVNKAIDLPKIASPTDFSVDAEGNYSFTGVEEAAYYLIYLCEPDATGNEDSYLYSSNQISSKGAVEYTGRLADEFDFSYGSYLAKVLAFPELSDKEHAKSVPVNAEYRCAGVLSEPDIAYYWNIFDEKMNIQVANINTYQYEVYPDQVAVTFTNVNDAGDQVVVTMEDISAENYAGETSELTKGETYEITAVASSESEFVEAAASDIAVVNEGLLVGETSIFTENYFYTDNFSSNYYSFPRVCVSFDLANGGEAGPGYHKGSVMPIEATPTDSTDGAAYSYTLVCRFYGKSFTGSLNLYSDGTFKFKEDGWGPVSPGSIEGCWLDNGDGTAVLSYNPDTVVTIK